VTLGWHGPTDASDLCLYTVDDPATGKSVFEKSRRVCVILSPG
jgi:hypothetical protein